MIDFHTHILPEVDDGALDIDETFNLIQEAKEAGFTAIISTSHYFEKRFVADVEERKTWLDAVSKNLANKPYKLDLYLGSEIFITSNMPELIENKEASSINDSRYILFELPFDIKETNLKNVVLDLFDKNYVPIIAHPERYKYVQDNPNYIFDLVEMGVLFQSNYGSIVGQYGKAAQKTVKVLLEHNLVHFLGSDVHRTNTIYKKIPEIIGELEKIIPKEEIDELTTINAKLVLSNEEIDMRRPQKVKTGFFSKMF